ncbi:hypothetical protein C8R44DRAFT_740792 [Mycena epipterygia]|nr:hypothetical protein C8R44DRAFT_740792 [Mycena epipterygia]
MRGECAVRFRKPTLMEDDNDPHVHIMRPEYVRRRYYGQKPRRRAPPETRADVEGPYGHGLEGISAPIVFCPPRRQQRLPVSGTNSFTFTRALRETDEELLARLAQSKAKGEREEQRVHEDRKRKAAPQEGKEGKPTKR